MNKGKKMLKEIIETKKKEVTAIKKQMSEINIKKDQYSSNKNFNKLDFLQEKAKQLSHQKCLLLEDIEELEEVLQWI